MSEETPQAAPPANQTLPPFKPEMQFAVYVGEIAPNNDSNVWNDWHKLVILITRLIDRLTASGDGMPQHATVYMKFGCRQGRSYMEAITKEDAERFMVETFWHQMRSKQVVIQDLAELPDILKPGPR